VVVTSVALAGISELHSSTFDCFDIDLIFLLPGDEPSSWY